MALAVREVMIVMHAKDLASRQIRQVGRSFDYMGRQVSDQSMVMASRFRNVGAGLMTAGAGMTFIGAMGVSVMNDMINASTDYSKSVSHTRTQVDGFNISQKELYDLGLEIAKNFPVAFENIQPALFDIFSSFEVGLDGAKLMMVSFAAAAVAGNSDIQTATRASIAVMNAYNLGVQDTGRVQDFFFQLVRKGIGTYDEFASTIGRAIPAARASNQSLETLGGTMAFLTRQGLSTAMASTSAARAFELLSKPEVTTALEEMGVAVKDGEGNFRQMNDIINDLAVNKGWAKMTGPELAIAFKETFGTGTIQARRFFNLAIPNFMQYQGLINDMGNSAGAMDEAYKIMFDSPANKMQLLENKYQALRVEIGQKLIPIKMRMLEIGNKILSWWNNLSPGVQKAIIYFMAFASIVMVVVGPLLVLAGLFATIVGVVVPFVATVGTAIAIVAGVIAAIIAFIAIIVLLVIHWDTVTKWIGKAWDWLYQKFFQIWGAIKRFFMNIPQWLKTGASKAWQAIQKGWDKILEFFRKLPGIIGRALARLAGILWEAFKKAFSAAVDAIMEFLSNVPQYFGWIVGAILAAIFGLPVLLGALFVLAVKAIWAVLQAWGPKIITFFLNLPMKIINALISLYTLLWELGLKAIKFLWNAFKSAVPKVISFFAGLPARIINALIDLVPKLVSKGWDAIVGLWNGFKSFFPRVITWIAGLPARIVRGLGNLAKILWGAGKKIIGGLWDGLKEGWKAVTGWIGGLAGKIVDLKGPPTYDAILLVENGGLIMEGFGRGLDKGWMNVQRKLKGYTSDINTTVTGSGSVGPIGGGRNVTVENGAVQIIVQGSMDESVIPVVQAAITEALHNVIVGVEGR